MKSRSRFRSVLLGYAFIAPWLAGFLVFTCYPILSTFFLSFCDYRVLLPPRWVGPANYQSLLSDPDYFWRSIFNTAFMFLEVPLSLLLGIGLALLLNLRLPWNPLYGDYRRDRHFSVLHSTLYYDPGRSRELHLFYALYLFQNAFQYFRMGYACAMAWLLFLISLLATWLILRLSAMQDIYEVE